MIRKTSFRVSSAKFNAINDARSAEKSKAKQSEAKARAKRSKTKQMKSKAKKKAKEKQSKRKSKQSKANQGKYRRFDDTQDVVPRIIGQVQCYR